MTAQLPGGQDLPPGAVEPEPAASIDATVDQAVELEGAGDEAEPRREVQTLRRTLRDAEAERDTAVAGVEALRRQLVDQAVAGQLSHPAALWAAGATVEDLFVDGTLDPARLRAAVDRAVDSLGAERSRRAPAHLPQQGMSHDGPGQAMSWADAIGQGLKR